LHALKNLQAATNPFTRMALFSSEGFFIQEKSGKALPEIVNVFSIAV
jgi:hypothetical protein